MKSAAAIAMVDAELAKPEVREWAVFGDPDTGINWRFPDAVEDLGSARVVAEKYKRMGWRTVVIASRYPESRTPAGPWERVLDDELAKPERVG